MKMKNVQRTKNVSTRMSSIDRQYLADYYRHLSDNIYNDTASGTPRGTFCHGFSDPVYPDPHKYFDFKGKTKEVHNFGLVDVKRAAMLVMSHSDYDQAPDPTVDHYLVDFTLNAMDHVTAGGQRGTAHNEWYLDHSGGWRATATGEIVKLPIVQNPTRHDNASTSDGDKVMINYPFPQLKCYPLGVAGIVTKGFEKDTTQPDSWLDEHFEIGLRDWVELFYDFGKACATKKFGEFAVDVVSMIAKAILSNADDPMNPSVTAISGGACRFILENCPNGLLWFEKTVLGHKAELMRVTNARDWGNDAYVQIAQYDEGRSYQLNYSLKITAVKK